MTSVYHIDLCERAMFQIAASGKQFYRFACDIGNVKGITPFKSRRFYLRAKA